jgi:predicted ArsR family transcriptional regulator
VAPAHLHRRVAGRRRRRYRVDAGGVHSRHWTTTRPALHAGDVVRRTVDDETHEAVAAAYDDAMVVGVACPAGHYFATAAFVAAAVDEPGESLRG